MSVDSTRHFDDKRAGRYDELIRMTVPGYDALHRMALLLLRGEIGAQARILAVGAGTGHEAILLAKADPTWRITAVEPAAAMAQAARTRIAAEGLNDRVEVVTGYCDDLPADEPFDAAVMVLVMHFVADDGGKDGLLRAISSRLKPAAPLILADLHAEVGGRRFERMMEAWRAFQLDAGMRPDMVEKGFEQIIRDIQFVPEQRILELLHQNGFAAVEPFFGAYLFGAWIAWKD